MLNNCLALITLTNQLDDMKSLLINRNYSTLQVGGRYKLIDFALSNIVNADITNVGVLGDLRKIESLVEHIGTGSSWDLDRKNDGVRYLTKYVSSSGKRGLLDLENNFSFFNKSRETNIVIINPAFVYNINLKEVLQAHESDDRDVTVIYKPVNDLAGAFYQCDTVNVNEDNDIESFGINLLFQEEKNISLDAFIIKKSVFLKLIGKQIENQTYDSISNMIKTNLKTLKMKGYKFDGYLTNISTVKDYYDFNLKLLDKNIREELFMNDDRPIFTKRKDSPSAIYKNGSVVENSLVSNGCEIRGTVKNSVLGRRVKIEEGAIVENCVIAQRCHIKKGAHLRCVIVDSDNIIPEQELYSSSPSHPLVIEKKRTILTETWKEVAK